jgi:hypothetical protein
MECDSPPKPFPAEQLYTKPTGATFLFHKGTDRKARTAGIAGYGEWPLCGSRESAGKKK